MNQLVYALNVKALIHSDLATDQTKNHTQDRVSQKTRQIDPLLQSQYQDVHDLLLEHPSMFYTAGDYHDYSIFMSLKKINVH